MKDTQSQVAKLLDEGLTTREISERLKINVSGVHRHKRIIERKGTSRIVPQPHMRAEAAPVANGDSHANAIVAKLDSEIAANDTRLGKLKGAISNLQRREASLLAESELIAGRNVRYVAARKALRG